MKKFIKNILILTFLIISICCVIPTKVEAETRRYIVDKMDIQATINEDGSLRIVQTMTYNFTGSYNGIYINVPYDFNDKEYSEAVKNSVLDEKMYNGSEVEVYNVSEMKNGKELTFTQKTSAVNGENLVYTSTPKDGLHEIKVYSPATSTRKTFKIDYIINDVCVKHKDIGELYYNFIGGAWEVEIKKLNIDIYLPNNEKEINIWGHGPYNGESKIVNNGHVSFKVESIKPGQYVAARVIFNNENINTSTKLSNINAKDLVFAEEKQIEENKEEKEKYTYKIIAFAVGLLIYWIVLLIVFEKDKKYKVSEIGEDELFEKYNPILAGCIQGSRNILARDIIAVILNLIEKGIIKLDIQNTLMGKDTYRYILNKDTEKEEQMDNIEKYIYDWVFEKKETIELSSRLEEMPKDKESSKKFKELSKKVEQELGLKGANQAKVPMLLRGFNVFLFILSIVLIVKHIMFNSFSVYNGSVPTGIFGMLGMMAFTFIPMSIGLLYIPLSIIIEIRHKINQTMQRVTGQKIVTTTVSLLVLFGIITIITAIWAPAKYLIADEILICIATIILLTDNLMLKHSVIMVEDYSKLNLLKEKIEDYSLMEDRDIEQITLWGKYLSYSVSFGISSKIIKRIKGLHLDDDLLELVESKNFSRHMSNGYYHFYMHSSLDRRFMKSYGKAMKSSGGLGSSSGSGGGFSGGGGYSGGGGRGGGRRSILKNKTQLSKCK